MPRYFFHTRIGDDVVTDEDGTDLRDPDHAWEKAKATIQTSLSDKRSQTRLMAAVLVVTDAAGEVVFEFPFAEVAALSPGSDRTVH